MKYYKAEDVIRAFKEWLAISEAAEDIIADLPTIEVSEDCISRANLIQDLRKDAERVEMEEFANDTVWRTIGNAPSVIPQPKEGEWIKQFNGTKCVCSICGYSNGRKHNDNFCPNCGSKMKGAE